MESHVTREQRKALYDFFINNNVAVAVIYVQSIYS